MRPFLFLLAIFMVTKVRGLCTEMPTYFKGEHVIAVTIFFLALLFRFWYLNELVIYDPIRGDAISYVQYSVNMLDHGVFSRSKIVPPTPDSYWAPGYPAFIVVSSQIGGLFNADTYDAVLSIQALLGALTTLLTWLVGRKFMGVRAAGIASIISLLSPHMTTLGGYFLTETLFCFLLVLSVYFFSLYLESQKYLWGLGCMLCFAAAYFVNPVILFAPLLLLVVTAIKEHDLHKNKLLVLSLFYLVFVGGWSLRGMITVSDDSPSSSDRVFTNLVIGSHADYHEIWRDNPRNPDNPATVDRAAFSGSYSLFLEAFAGRIADKPFHYLKWYLWDKPKLLWDWDILVGHGDIYVFPVASSIYFKSHFAIATVALMKGLHPLLFLCALGGAGVAIRQLWKADSGLLPAALMLIVVYVSAVYVVLQSEPRYSIPLRPEMYLLSVYCMSHVLRYVSGRVCMARAKANA